MILTTQQREAIAAVLDYLHEDLKEYRECLANNEPNENHIGKYLEVLDKLLCPPEAHHCDYCSRKREDERRAELDRLKAGIMEGRPNDYDTD